MNNKQFYTALKRVCSVHSVNNAEHLSKRAIAKFGDAIAFCERHMSEEANPLGKAPKNYTEMMAQLLKGAGATARYNCDKWESYVRGCGAMALTPDADAIRDHYFTEKEIAAMNLSWNNYPPMVKDWQEYEARRLHAAADMLCSLADNLGLFLCK